MAKDLSNKNINKFEGVHGLGLKWSFSLNKNDFGQITQVSWSPSGRTLALESETKNHTVGYIYFNY